MDKDADLIPLAHARPAVSARVGSRLMALVLLWAAAMLTALVWAT